MVKERKDTDEKTRIMQKAREIDISVEIEDKKQNYSQSLVKILRYIMTLLLIIINCYI